MIKKVTSGLRIGGAGWPERISWTNLYRVSPAARDTALREAQLKACRRLLRYEVDRLRPEVILVFSGQWWFEPFADSLGVHLTATDGNLVEAVGQVAGSRVVVSPHPQGKPEAVLVREILEAVGSAD